MVRIAKTFAQHSISHIAFTIQHLNLPLFRRAAFTRIKGDVSFICDKLVLGIGQENHNRLSGELNRLIIDCTIGFLLAMSNNIQFLTYNRSLKDYHKPEHVSSWLKIDCQTCKVIISCQRCKVIHFTVETHQ